MTDTSKPFSEWPEQDLIESLFSSMTFRQFKPKILEELLRRERGRCATEIAHLIYCNCVNFCRCRMTIEKAQEAIKELK